MRRNKNWTKTKYIHLKCNMHIVFPPFYPIIDNTIHVWLKQNYQTNIVQEKKKKKTVHSILDQSQVHSPSFLSKIKLSCIGFKFDCFGTSLAWSANTPYITCIIYGSCARTRGYNERKWVWRIEGVWHYNHWQLISNLL